MTTSAAYDPFTDSDRPGLFTAARLTQLATILLFALLIGRSTMLELVRDPFEVSPGQGYTPLGTGPTMSVILNLLALIPAALILLRRAIDPTYRLLRVISPLAFAALALLAFFSYRWSPDWFPAAMAGSTLAAAAAMCWAASQLIRSWGRFRLLLVIILGLLAVYAAQGLFYRYFELPDLQANVERTKDTILREHDLEPGSFAAEQFLRRISGAEMIGFGSSPNTYAAAIVLMALTSAGLVAHGILKKRDPVLVALTAVPILAGAYVAYFTHSNTAVATPVLAVILFLCILALRGRTLTHRKSLFALGILLFLLGSAALIGHGLHHHSLPTASLNFRWRYWTASWNMFFAHPLLGTGYANFAETYLHYRLPAAAEEIRDPHNLLVRFATELGAIGLTLSLLWLLILWWEATRPLPVALHPPSEVRPPISSDPDPGLKTFAIAVNLGILINIFCSIDFGSDTPFVVIEVFKRLMYAGVLVVFGALALIRNRTSTDVDDEPAPWTLLAATIAIGMFFVHNLIDFSFFEPSPLTLFSILLGGILSIRSRDPRAPDPFQNPASDTRHRAASAATLALLVLTGAIYLFKFALPVISAESFTRAADEKLRLAKVGETLYPQRFEDSARLCLLAALTLPGNPEYFMHAYRARLLGGSPDTAALRDTLDRAIAADPLHIRARLERARLEQRLAHDGDPTADLPRALTEFAEAIRLTPVDVGLRLEYAALLDQAGRPAEAITQMETALKYDSLLDLTEPKRLTRQKIEEVEAKLRALRLALPPATRP